MNPKTRALLWEELRVGGSIAAACTLVGIVIQITPQLQLILNGNPENTWNHAKDFILMATLGVPIFTSLLLILSVASSGNLAAGFSRRILRLPVDTWRAVLIVLITRLVEAFAVSAALIGTCWAICHHGPGLRTVFLLAGVFLVFQVLTWALEVVPILAGLAIVVLIVFPLVQPGGIAALGESALATAPPTPAFLLACAASVVAAYAVSVVLVRLTRRGDKFFTASMPTFDGTRFGSSTRRRKPFSSPMAAQLWYERRRAGVFLPVTVLVIWILCVGVRWLMLYSLHTGTELVDFRDLLDTTWLFEYFPYIALALAGLAWTQRNGSSTGLSGARPAGFMQRLPITKAQAACTRLITAAMNLVPVLVVIAVVFAVHFVWVDRGAFARIADHALAHGQTTPREIAAFLVGIPLLAGLIVWSVMNVPARVMAAITALGVVSVLLFYATVCIGSAVHFMRNPDVAMLLIGTSVAACLVIWLSVRFAIPGQRAIVTFTALLLAVVYSATFVDFSRTWPEYMTWLFLTVAFVIITPPLLLAGSLAAAWRVGLISARSLGACVLAWAAATLLVFPFATPNAGDETATLFMLSLCAGALPVLPFVLIVLDLGYRGLQAPLAPENPAQHSRLRQTRMLPIHAFGGILLVGVAALLVWVRWPAESAYKAKLRAQGIPATLDELDRSYPPVAPERNLALVYLQIAKDHEARDTAFRNEYRRTTNNSELILLGEDSRIERTKPVPLAVWRTTKEYCERVGNVTCAALEAAAHSGLHESRYPVDIKQLPWTQLNHLSRLRHASYSLAVQSQVAGVEGNGAAAVEAILDILPIADSLKDEPVYISQLVRVGFLGSACAAAESLLNRTRLSEEELARLQDGLAGALPPAEKQSLLERGLVGEQAWLTDFCEHYSLAAYAFAYAGVPYLDGSTMEGQWVLFQYCALNVLTDLAGERRLDPMCMSVGFDDIRNRARETATQHRVIEANYDKAWKKHKFIWTPATCLLMPNLANAYRTEWRIRARVVTAQAGIAVERFRLAHGRLPKRLEELVPQFLDSVPRPPQNNGGPLAYRIKEDGEFVVYTFGDNREDNLGRGWEEACKPEGDDITFKVAPPEVRDRPQVAPDTVPPQSGA